MKSASYYKYKAQAKIAMRKPPAQRSRYYARKKLINFTEYTFEKYVTERMHRLIANELDKIIRKQNKRLIIVAPPQHGKSELTARRFPAMWMGTYPEQPVIATSYSADRAVDNSEIARDIILSEKFKHLFPDVGLSGTSTRKDFWKLNNPQGFMRATGIGGGIMGLGAMLGIIDDPFSDWGSAQRQNVRDAVWNWFLGTFRNRMREGAAIFLIMTRWHEDDMVGRLLLSQPGVWKIIRLPAIAESQDERDEFAEKYDLPLGEPDLLLRKEGEVLAPKRFSKEAILEMKKEMGSMVFSALYQGSPRPPEGNVFKDFWFTNKYVSRDELAMRNIIARVRYWDKAGTQDGGAYTVGLLMAMDADGLFYIEDVVRKQLSPFERNKLIAQIAKYDYERYGHQVSIVQEQEPGSGGKESAMIMERMLAGYNIRTDRVQDSKGSRLIPFIAQCEAGNVYMVEATWNKSYLGELLDWSDDAKYKDQADASSGAFNMLTLENSGTAKNRAKLAQAINWKGRNMGR